MRIEKDHIGQKKIPKNALYGIHALRAKENFPVQNPFAIEWYKAVGKVKLAFYKTYMRFSKEVGKRYQDPPISLINAEVIDAMATAAVEVSDGKYFEHFIVPAVQGGAGTSINMNVNEIIANTALIKYGKKPGDYDHIHPIEHANVYQSTNDVIPTALRVAVMDMLDELEQSVNDLRAEIELLERNYNNALRIGYTQMQEAVPTSWGRMFGAYSDALSRDWWRVSKCFERIKVVNLGGSAIGTGITVPRFFIMEVVQTLQSIINKPLTRAENMLDATSNLDALVEVHAIIKAHAVNMEKMVNDIRLLSSDIMGNKDLEIPSRQVGSSIMPGKVNPVIPEFVVGAVQKVYSNDMLIAALSGQGCLELNANLPMIGHSMIESIKLLIACDKAVKDHLLNGLKVNIGASGQKLWHSPVIVTALLPFIGYKKAEQLAKTMKEKKINVFDANHELKLMEDKKLKEILKPENLLKEGFSLKEI